MKVGTLPWLLRHELLLWWREISSRPRVLIGTILLGLLFAGLFGTLWFSLGDIREVVSSSTIPDFALWIAVGVWLLGFFYAFTQAMGYSLVALFERGDLDLLVSSPVSSKVIFASRLLGVALEIFLSSCVFVVPVSLIAVVLGIPQLLGLYPAAIGISLMATSLAMLLTLVLVRRMGARRSRTVAQVLTAILSTLVFLGLRLPYIIKGNNFNNQPFWRHLQIWFANGPLGADSFVWFPARAIFFDPVAVLLTLLISGTLTWVAVETLHRSFMRGTQQSVTQKQRQLRPTEATHFASGINRVVLFKEWRIIWRNPYLLSRIFLQIVFAIASGAIVLQGNNSTIADIPTFVCVTSIGVGGVLTSTLSSICVSGEEAPDLLKSSPINGTQLRRLKLLAALIPVWLLLSPLFIILMILGEPWLIPLLIFLPATISSALLSLSNSRPIRLTDMFQRRQNSRADFFLGILETLSWMMWVWLGLTMSWGRIDLAFLPLVAIVLVMAIGYWRSRQLGTSLGY